MTHPPESAAEGEQSATDSPADPIAESKAIQRETGTTFHLATRVLPGRARHATYVLYAFLRLADDVVDVDRAYWWYPGLNAAVGAAFTLAGLWGVVGA